MIIKGIPSGQIVSTAARVNKDYDLEFANSDSNSDVYVLRIFIRKFEQQYKVRLVLNSSILAYPALEMAWVFNEEDYELASRVFHRICDEADDVKVHYDRSMAPASIIASKLREAVKPISVSHQEKTNIPSLDEANRLAGVSDWRYSIYSNRYPNMTRSEKQKITKYEGNQKSEPIETKAYKTRERY